MDALYSQYGEEGKKLVLRADGKWHNQLNGVFGARRFENITSAGVVAAPVPVVAGATSGTGDTYTITTHLGLTSYPTNLALLVKFDEANTGACSLNVDGLGAKSLKIAGNDPADNDIDANKWYWVVYDGTNFEIVPGI